MTRFFFENRCGSESVAVAEPSGQLAKISRKVVLVFPSNGCVTGDGVVFGKRNKAKKIVNSRGSWSNYPGTRPETHGTSQSKAQRGPSRCHSDTHRTSPNTTPKRHRACRTIPKRSACMSPPVRSPCSRHQMEKNVSRLDHLESLLFPPHSGSLSRLLPYHLRKSPTSYPHGKHIPTEPLSAMNSDSLSPKAYFVRGSESRHCASSRLLLGEVLPACQFAKRFNAAFDGRVGRSVGNAEVRVLAAEHVAGNNEH